MTPGGADFDRAVAQIDEYIEAIGDEIIDTFSDDSDPTRTTGFGADHSGWRYAVEGDPEKGPRFSIVFPFSILNNLEELLDEDAADEVIAGKEDIPGDDTRTKAAFQVLDSVHDATMEEFRYHLIDQISTTDAAYDLRQVDDVVYGFDVTRRVYPLDEGCTLTEFSHSVQTVISAGIGGVRFVNQAFDFETLVDGITGDPEELRYLH